MASDVKWIKITTDIFDDEKILLIESLPDAYAIIVVWFKLLCLAGKQNNSGVFMMGRIAYTDKMLATIFRMKESTVSMALKTFQEFGMVEIIDGVITIPNWGKHQNLDQLETKKEYMRNYMKEYREKQKALTSGKPSRKTNSKTNVSQADKEGDKEKEKDTERECKRKEKEKNEPHTPEKHAHGSFQHVLLAENEFVELCDEYGVVLISKAITFLDEYIEEKDYKSNSHFLAIKRWVLDAVKERESKKTGGSGKTSYDLEAFERMIDKGLNPPKTAAEDEAIRARMEELQKQLA